eukprot:2904917-Pleurochrysis_carterae.AAC.3
MNASPRIRIVWESGLDKSSAFFKLIRLEDLVLDMAPRAVHVTIHFFYKVKLSSPRDTRIHASSRLERVALKCRKRWGVKEQACVARRARASARHSASVQNAAHVAPRQIPPAVDPREQRECAIAGCGGDTEAKVARAYAFTRAFVLLAPSWCHAAACARGVTYGCKGMVSQSARPEGRERVRATEERQCARAPQASFSEFFPPPPALREARSTRGGRSRSADDA